MGWFLVVSILGNPSVCYSTIVKYMWLFIPTLHSCSWAANFPLNLSIYRAYMYMYISAYYIHNWYLHMYMYAIRKYMYMYVYTCMCTCTCMYVLNHHSWCYWVTGINVPLLIVCVWWNTKSTVWNSWWKDVCITSRGTVHNVSYVRYSTMKQLVGDAITGSGG